MFQLGQIIINSMFAEAIGVDVFVCFPTLSNQWQRDIQCLDQFIAAALDSRFPQRSSLGQLARQYVLHSSIAQELSRQVRYLPHTAALGKELQRHVLRGLEQYGIRSHDDWLACIKGCVETWKDLHPTVGPWSEPQQSMPAEAY